MPGWNWNVLAVYLEIPVLETISTINLVGFNISCTTKTALT